MKVGIVPTKYGYSAVALGPFDDGKWELETPKHISDEHLLQLRSQIAQRIAEWCQQLSPWRYTLPVAIPWAAWGAVVLAMYYTTIYNIAPKYVLLYGWIRLFFFGDGIRVLTQTLYHLPGVLRARRVAKRLLTGNWDLPHNLTVLLPLRSPPVADETEEEYLRWLRGNYSHTAPYYDAMLEKRPPAIFDWWPLGAVGWLKRFFLGPKFRFPPMIFELGVLEVENDS